MSYWHSDGRDMQSGRFALNAIARFSERIMLFGMRRRKLEPAVVRVENRRSGRRRRERGAALVEMSLIAGLLVSLSLGALELGQAWSDHQLLTQASRNAARTASQLGDEGAADREALRAIEAMYGADLSSVTRVVIFKAEADGSIPAACETASAPGIANLCNVYEPAQLIGIGDDSKWGSGNTCGLFDAKYCPTTRSNLPSAPEYIGAEVEVRRSWLTGYFGNAGHDISDRVVMRIEPIQK